MNLRKREHGATGYFYSGYPDFEEMLFLKKILKRNDVFIDVGANSGGWSLTAFGLGASVIAFEPVTTSFNRLFQNFQLNKSERLKALNYGVSEQAGVLKFSIDSDTGNRVVSELSNEKSEMVPSVTLDEELDRVNPTVIKIDVEGHELSVIKGAERILNRPSLKALIIETFRGAKYDDADFKEMEKRLNEKGFKPVEYNPRTHGYRTLEQAEGGQNTIYLKDFQIRAHDLPAAS